MLAMTCVQWLALGLLGALSLAATIVALGAAMLDLHSDVLPDVSEAYKRKARRNIVVVTATAAITLAFLFAFAVDSWAVVA